MISAEKTFVNFDMFYMFHKTNMGEKMLQYLQLIVFVPSRIQKEAYQKHKKMLDSKNIHGSKYEGEFHFFVKDLQFFDQEYFFRCFFMSPTIFEQLLALVALFIKKKSTKMGELIGVSERFCV